MKVRVDFDRCKDNARCVIAAPEVFRTDPETGFLLILQEEPEEHLRDSVEAAADACPTQAISIEG